MELTTISKRDIHSKRSKDFVTPFAIQRDASDFPIIVYSHLAWDWVWQRPQQFHSRLSKTHPILFVESPTAADEVAESCVTLREVSDYPNIVVLQVQIPAARLRSGGAWVESERRRLIQSVLEGPLGRKFENSVQWFYDPMAVRALAGHLDEQAIVYDCMDELSQFKGAPRELVRRERELLSVADVVFAGGPKMARSKSRFHSNCHSFGCGVDVKHFGKARHARTKVPQEIVAMEGPVLGYIGVVDERLDYELLAKLADHDPKWNVAMVGPWTKVDPAEFPVRPNLHFLGGRDYGVLPAYAKGFDVCLMPFAKNAATEYINPTKALEYLATGTPIVSTDVEDVVLQFSNVMSAADSHDEFISACEEGLTQPNARRIRAGMAMARRNSWEAIVAQLEKHVENVLSLKRKLTTTAA